MIKQYQPLIKPSWIQGVHEALNNGYLGPGKLCQEFESALQTKYGYKHVILTTSGTTALMVAMKAMLGEGKRKILAPSYTFLAGHNAARFLGYDVELVDINPETLCMDINELRNKLYLSSKKLSTLYVQEYDLVLFVNHNAFNDYAVLEELKDLSDYYHIPILEDSSQGIHVRYSDCDDIKYLGSVGDCGILSFSVPKLLTTGQGGAIITSDADLADKCRRLIDHGGGQWRTTRIHEETGINLRMTDMQAAYGLAQLNEIDGLYKLRQNIHGQYKKNLGESYVSGRHAWMALYRCQHQNAKYVSEQLLKNNIEAKQYYVPIHYNAPYIESQGQFPIAEKIYDELLYLPSSLNLSIDDIDNICELLSIFDKE